MSKIITRNILNKDFSITVHHDLYETSTYKKDELEVYINRAKTYLIKEKNCQPGQLVFLADITWPSYLAWFFACAELGLTFIISDVPVQAENFSYVGTRLKEIYGKIDFYIGSPEFGRELFGDSYSDINRDILFEYSDDSYKDVLRATPDTLLIKSMTSGTTGEPKLAFHSHGFFYDLMIRNSKVFNFKKQNRCLHTKILHHGSVIGVYFLPTLYSCARHFWISCVPVYSKSPVKFLPGSAPKFTGKNVRAGLVRLIMASVIKHQQIDKALLFYDMIEHIYDFIKNSTKDKLTLFVLSPVKDEILDVLIGTYKYEIVSIFGCTESSGPIFLQTLNYENFKSFDKKCFGELLDDFYKVNISDNQLLEITMPDNSKVIPGDRFEKNDSKYYFLGRQNTFKIKDQTVIMTLLIEFIEKRLAVKHGESFNLIFDQPNERIFIRYEGDLNLVELNNEIQKELGASYIIHYHSNKNMFSFMSGIKFDADMFRRYCNAELNKEN